MKAQWLLYFIKVCCSELLAIKSAWVGQINKKQILLFYKNGHIEKI